MFDYRNKCILNQVKCKRMPTHRENISSKKILNINISSGAM